MDLYDQLLRDANKTGKSIHIHEVWLSIGKSNQAIGNFPAAFEAYQNAIAACDGADPACPLSAIAKLGILQAENGNPHLAIPYFRESMELATQVGDSLTANRSLNQFGIVYTMMGDWARADSCFQGFLAFAQQLNDTILLATAINNLGDMYLQKGAYDLAEANFKKSLVLYTPYNQSQALATPHLNLGLLYLRRGDFAIAEKQALIGLDYALKAKSLIRQQNAYEVLWQAQEGLNKPQDALRNFKLLTAIRDSLFSLEKTKQIAELESRYRFSLQNEILASKDEALASSQTKVSQQRIWLAISLGIGIVLLFVIFLLRKRFLASSQRAALDSPEDDSWSLLAFLSKQASNELKLLAPGATGITQSDPGHPATAMRLQIFQHLISDFAQNRSREVAPNISEADIPGLLREVTTAIRPITKEKFISLLLDIDADIPDSLQTDSRRLQEVFLLLLMAVIELSRRGKVAVMLKVSNRESSFIDLTFEIIATGGGQTTEMTPEIKTQTEIISQFVPFLIKPLGGEIKHYFGNDGYLSVSMALRTLVPD